MLCCPVGEWIFSDSVRLYGNLVVGASTKRNQWRSVIHNHPIRPETFKLVGLSNNPNLPDINNRLVPPPRARDDSHLADDLRGLRHLEKHGSHRHEQQDLLTQTVLTRVREGTVACGTTPGREVHHDPRSFRPCQTRRTDASPLKHRLRNQNDASGNPKCPSQGPFGPPLTRVAFSRHGVDILLLLPALCRRHAPATATPCHPMPPAAVDHGTPSLSRSHVITPPAAPTAPCLVRISYTKHVLRHSAAFAIAGLARTSS